MIVAICLVVLLTVAALSLDGGRLLAERRQVQAAADAAAEAAALELYTHKAPEQTPASTAGIRQCALAIATANGYTNDGTVSAVQVNIPPRSGQFCREKRIHRGRGRVAL